MTTLRLKTNQYAIAALKDRRATLAGEIEQFKQGIHDREEMLAHLDATLRALDPSYRADTVAPKRIRRVKLFGGGELNRLILDALRKGDGKPLTNVEIAAAIVAAKGYGEEAMPALIRRVRANLSYLRRQERVTKTGDRMTALWSLA
jgi:hypothetical protein